MKGEFRTLDTRHEEKMIPIGGKPHPGDDRDRRLPLSYQGQQNAYKTGQNPDVIPKGFDIVVADRSTLVRTTMTGQHMFAGAGYDPDIADSVIWKPEDVRIGLANGMDFGHEVLPPYSPINPAADNYVSALLRETWLPVEGGEESNRPVASALAFALLDNRIKTIEEYIPEVAKGAKVFHAQFIHAPYIDTLDAALFSTVNVQDDAVTLNKWPGHYPMGEYITSKMVGKPEDPVFIIQGKNAQNGTERNLFCPLDALKAKRDHLYEISKL
jgi:hypothetical protein